MPISKKQKIAIFGGSGFIGTHIIKTLLPTGAQLRIISRHPKRVIFLETEMLREGQIEFFQADILHKSDIDAAIEGCDMVINTIGILFERGAQKFSAIQAQSAAYIAQTAARFGVKKLIHISAIGADDNSPSAYARSKAQGEKAVQDFFEKAIILRPSLVIGPEDDFFNRFAQMIKFAPALPLIGGGQTKFQPVSVYDLACAVKTGLEKPIRPGIYEIGGAKIYRFEELMKMLLTYTQKRRFLIPLPFPVAHIIAQFAQFLPSPPLTPDQLRLLRYDNIVTSEKTISDFKIIPQSIEEIVPQYLSNSVSEMA